MTRKSLSVGPALALFAVLLVSLGGPGFAAEATAPPAPPEASAVAPPLDPAAPLSPEGEAAKPAETPQPEKVVKPKKPKKLTRGEIKKRISALPEAYRAWVEEAQFLLTDEELATFVELEKDYQRDAFIKRFWQVRDPYPETARNEFKDRWESGALEAKAQFGSFADDRARVMLFNGPPDGRIGGNCATFLWPIEVWFYGRGNRLREEFVVVFVQRWGVGVYRIWDPSEGIQALFIDPGSANIERVATDCRNGDSLAAGIGWVANQRLGYLNLRARIEEPPGGPSGEWTATFNSYSTDIPPGAATFPAKLELAFPGRRQNRTVVQGVAAISPADLGQAVLGDHRSYNLLVTGELLEGKDLFDSFRYKFDFPGQLAPETTIPLVFQRFLRPGNYKLIVKIEDMNGQKYHRIERELEVPTLEGDEAPRAPMDPATARLLAEANEAIARGDATLRLLAPAGDLQTGMQRFDALTTGQQIAKVSFALDGKAVLTDGKPPFSVELDLGSLPRNHQLVATAIDASGRELARDELALNAATQRFRVRLVEPQRSKRYVSSLQAEAEVSVPDGEEIERVEFFLDETLIATAYQPPFAQAIVLPKDLALGYVRAVAYLTDGNSTEDLVFVNAPDDFQQLKIQFVELYTSATDRTGRPVAGLEASNFKVSEDGVPQEIVRFEQVENLPIHAAVLLDTSASMDPNIEAVRTAALHFYEKTIQPKDRAALITFNDHPNLAVKFTKDVTALAGGLAGIKAERGTALYDCLIFSLYYFNGVKGQRALLLLSDGKDEASKFTYEDALDFARRAGVTIYTIGLGKDLDKKKLTRLAEETGGRSYFLETTGALASIYTQIEKELRSKYLIAYQSTNVSNETDFRSVDLKVDASGVDVKTLRGYYP